MMKVVLLDKEDFCYSDLQSKPFGGAQTAFIELVNAFVRAGYFVFVRNHTKAVYFDKGIDWQSFASGGVPVGDLYIVNRSVELLRLVPKQHKRILWLHNHGKYLLKPSVLLKLFRYYPKLIFSGKYHKSSFLLSFIFKCLIIPLGVSRIFLDSRIVNSHTKPKVIFTSNPLRSLKWLIDRWRKIRERVPNAELYIFAGSEVYGSWGRSVKMPWSNF